MGWSVAGLFKAEGSSSSSSAVRAVRQLAPLTLHYRPLLDGRVTDPNSYATINAFSTLCRPFSSPSFYLFIYLFIYLSMAVTNGKRRERQRETLWLQFDCVFKHSTHNTALRWSLCVITYGVCVTFIFEGLTGSSAILFCLDADLEKLYLLVVTTRGRQLKLERRYFDVNMIFNLA